MNKIIVALIAGGFFLSACDAQFAEKGAVLCEQYGYIPGTEAFAQCVQKEVSTSNDRMSQVGANMQGLDQPQPSIIIVQ